MAIGPKQSLLVGTFLQPFTTKPSASNALFKAARCLSAIAISKSRNTIPTAYCLGNSIPKSVFTTSRRKLSGFWINRPQPSPVLPSAAIPPRWVIQVKDSIAVLKRS